MQLLAKVKNGDCEAAMSEASLADGKLRPFKNTAYEFKLQLAEPDKDLLWIRIGVHPQRCLCVGPDGTLRFMQCFNPSSQKSLWRVHYLEAEQPTDEATQLPAMCFFQNVKTGLFLSVQDGAPILQARGEIWGIARLRGAMTPGRVLRRGAIVSGVGATVASGAALGLAGAAAATAVTRTAAAVSATGAAVSGTSAAVSGAAAAVSGATVVKVVTAAAAIPSAILAALTAGKGTLAVAASLGTVVWYSAVGAGCGVALGTGGTVIEAVAMLMSDARDSGLYVTGYPFVPKEMSQTLSKLSTRSLSSLSTAD
jgi:hypothetical protein